MWAGAGVLGCFKLYWLWKDIANEHTWESGSNEQSATLTFTSTSKHDRAQMEITYFILWMVLLLRLVQFCTFSIQCRIFWFGFMFEASVLVICVRSIDVSMWFCPSNPFLIWNSPYNPWFRKEFTREILHIWDPTMGCFILGFYTSKIPLGFSWRPDWLGCRTSSSESLVLRSKLFAKPQSDVDVWTRNVSCITMVIELYYIILFFILF